MIHNYVKFNGGSLCLVFGVSAEPYLLLSVFCADTATSWLKETQAAMGNAALMILLKRTGMYHCKEEWKEKAGSLLVSPAVVRYRVALWKLEAQ